MAAITKEQAEKLFTKLINSYKTICPKEKLSFKLTGDENNGHLSYYECVNGRPRAKVIVGLDDKGQPKITSSVLIGPDSPALNLMPRIKIKKSETKFTTRHGSKAREC